MMVLVMEKENTCRLAMKLGVVGAGEMGNERMS